MELKGYLAIISRRKWLIIATTVAVVAIVTAGTLSMTPLYQATVTLRVATAAEGTLDYIAHNTNYSDRLMNTYVRVAMSAPMQAKLENALGLKVASVKVAILANTELLQINVEDQNPIVAARAANALGDLLIAYVKTAETAGGITGQGMLGEQLGQAQAEMQHARNQYADVMAKTPDDAEAVDAANRMAKVKEDTYVTLLGLYDRVRATQGLRNTPLSLIEPATIPQQPSEPRKAMNIGLGLVIGILGGVGLAFLLENLDTSLNSTEQIEQATKRTVIGEIPRLNHGNRQVPDSDSPEGEAFRHVRTSLLSFVQHDSPQTLLVTSAETGEGKSTIAANLAHTLAQTGRRVLLIDCDLRLPTIHKMLNLSNNLGLSDILAQKKEAEKVEQFSRSIRAWVITSGVLPRNPAELLGSVEMTELIREAAQRFDFIILDAPSLLAVTDPVVLASKVDVTLLVVDGRRAKQSAVKAACRVLDGSKAKAVGIIVNRAGPDGRHGYYHKRQKSQKRAAPMPDTGS